MDSRTDNRRHAGYLPALDGLRGLAVLSVIAFHLARYAPDSDGMLGAFLVGVVRFGWVGVDLFFVLSGFLITGILYDNLGRAGYFRAFYCRRALRILPLHITALVILSAVYAFVGGPTGETVLDALPWHAAFLTNVRVANADSWSVAPAGTGHLWSLAVEEQFYLVWPFVVAGVARLAGRDVRPALIVTCVAMIATAVASRVTLVGSSPLAAYVLYPTRMDSLAVGGGLALWLRGAAGPGPVRVLARPVVTVIAPVVLLLAWRSASPQSYFHPLQASIGYTLWAVLFAAVVALVISPRGSRMTAALELRPLKYVGRISFGLYVVHLPVLHGLALTGIADQSFELLAIATMGASFLLAAVSWHALERPALNFKRYFRYGDVHPTMTNVFTPDALPGNATDRLVVGALRTTPPASTLIANRDASPR